MRKIRNAIQEDREEANRREIVIDMRRMDSPIVRGFTISQERDAIVNRRA